MIKVAMCALAILALPAAAAENQVLKCKTGVAARSGPSGGPALVADIPNSMTPIDLNAVQMTDKALTKAIIVEALFASRTPTNGLHVVTRLVNCTKKPLVVQARSSFMDKNQIPTEHASAWKTVYISPLATATYEESSIGRELVAAFLIELRPDL